MIILPVGQSQTEVRRQPWVSYTIIALNLAFYLLVHGVLSGWIDDQRKQLRSKAVEIFTYLAEHPKLEIPEDLRELAGPDFEKAVAEARSQRPPERSPSAETLAAQEQQLRTLVAELLQLRASGPIVRLGFTPARPGLLTLFTSMFVHAGFWHLLGNMLFLFVTGPFLEDLYGRPLFAVLYLVGGVVATTTYAFKTLDPSVTLIGASGAIAAVMGAFLVRLGAARIKLLIIPIPILWMLRFVVRVPAFVFLPLWFAEQLFLAHVAPEAGVAFWAHIGGFCFGAAAAGVVRLARIEERLITPAIESEISLQSHPSLEPAIDARVRGDFETARRKLRDVLRDLPNDRDAWAESFRLAVASGDRQEAGRLAGRVLDLYERANERDLAAAFVDEAQQALGDELPPRFCLSAAQVRERQQDFLSARELYELVIQRHGADASAFWAHFRRGRILQRAGDARGAHESFERARAHPACLDPLLVDRALAELERAEAQRPMSGPQ